MIFFLRKHWLFFLLLGLVLGVVHGVGFDWIPMTLAQDVKLDLIPPTQVPGFAEGITVGDGNITSLVVLVTNYVLGFLGLVAITAIIYAGILYVANFGNDDLTGKAKSIITYVAIGIVVILMSYAIVNALVGVANPNNVNNAGTGVAGSPGRIGIGDRPVTTLDSLFDVEGKDFVFPLITSLRNLGDLCPSTPIGLGVDNFGCAPSELVIDTDADGIANILDTDDDGDGITDLDDVDVDGDGVCDGDARDNSCSSGPDLCPFTLSFVNFKVSNIELPKIQVDRVSQQEYNQFIQQNQGCAEYESTNDIDGDGISDLDDCDADGDGQVDNADCARAFVDAFPPGNVDNANITPDTIFRGVKVFNVFRNSLDDDDDSDGVPDFTNGLQPDDRDLLLRQIANNFSALESFIRTTCATLPQTQRVLDFCGYNPQGDPFGRLVRLLDQLSSDLAFTDFDTFNEVYQEFLGVAKAFPKVQVGINASQFEGFLPADNSPFRVSFDASTSIDPYEEFCTVDENNYIWFVNKTLDFSQGLSGILNSSLNPPDATGLFFDHDFTESGVFNVQLLVRSACKYNVVNPGAGEREDVDAAIAGLANARISIFPSRARLLVSVNGGDDQGNRPIKILNGTQTPIEFDLTQSSTSRGTFQSLSYDCGNGQTSAITGNETNWKFSCSYSDANGSKTIIMQARDGEGEVRRNLALQFNDVIAQLDVSPGLVGTTDTAFTFDGTQSRAAQQISNFTYIVEQKIGTGFDEVERFQDPTVTYNFPASGEFKVTLQVSTGGAANQVSTDSVNIRIDEQDPIAAFTITYPETIRPARALFNGSLSFHPDFAAQDVLDYIWEVDGVVTRERGAGFTGPFTYEQVTAGSDAQVFFDFLTVGKHQVRLTVVKGEGRDTVLEPTEVTTLLGVDFSVDNPAARINEVITFTPESDKALGYFWDFADGETLVGTDEPVVHIYEKQGEYRVSLTVEDAVGNSNELVKTIRVGLQNAPVAFVQVFINDIEKDLTQSSCIEVTRRSNVLFDATDSVNVKGDRSGLAFLWEIEDAEEVVRTRSFNRIFKDLTAGGCLDIELTVTDLSTQVTDVIETISVEVVNEPPNITDVRYTVTEAEQVTPVSVSVSVMGVRDLDGRAVRYRWWYFEEGQGSRQLDSRITDVPRTTFVIGPNNVEGTDTTYFFAVEVEDNDGGTTNSLNAVGPSEPLVVTNGPNIAPIAEFVTDLSMVSIGEPITFTSTTVDPLGEFIPSAGFKWDFEGDGEFERGITGPRVTHKYTGPGTFTPTLLVTKNGLSSQYEMKVRVIPDTKEPEAAFIFVQSGAKVKFISNSTVDEQLDNKDLIHAWDFDTKVDTDGNGIPDDDADSALLAPDFEFEGNQDVLVGLIVTDSVGNEDQVIRKIPFIKQDTDRGPLGSTKQIPLRAALTTNPPRNEVDGKVYLIAPFSDVVFNAQKSQGKIQEYRLDTNIFADSDGDEIPDNDIDNKTHKSWKDGSSFKRTYRESEGRIRARLTTVSLLGNEKSQVVDIVFSDEIPSFDIDTTQDPDALLQLLDAVPVVSFDVDKVFAQPGDGLVFDASRTKFPDEKVEEYRWDFDGDGLIDEISFEPIFNYAYDIDGVFDVILEAVSVDGLQGEYSQTVFIRGGLELPEAIFTYELIDNEVRFTNVSTVDSSFTEEELQFEWSFKRLDLSTALPWETFDQVDELVIETPEFNQAPVWVQKRLELAVAELGAGVVSRELALGVGPIVIQFTEGTTLVDESAAPYVGSIELSSGNDDVIVEEEVSVVSFDTSIPQVLSSSSGVDIVYKGVIFDAKLYQVESDGSTSLVVEGTIDSNVTRFVTSTLAGSYLITGELEASSANDEGFLGLSTVKDPVKVFSEAGLYQVVLKVTDGLGETGEQLELITIDQDLQLVEPGTVSPEDILDGGTVVETPDNGSNEPILTTPVIIDDSGDSGGLSYFWIALLLVILLIVAIVVFIVIRTIRQRQSELESHSDLPSSAKAEIPDVVEPEIVEPAPAAPVPVAPVEKKAPEVSPVSTPAAPVKPAQPAAPEKENKAGDLSASVEKKKGDDDKGPSGPQGPIPDWLKN
jgi:PKD repeat protein